MLKKNQFSYHDIYGDNISVIFIKIKFPLE